MSQVDEILQLISELPKSEQQRVYMELHHRFQENVELEGSKKMNKERMKDWDNEVDKVFDEL